MRYLAIFCMMFCVAVCYGQNAPKADANGVLIVAPDDTVAAIASTFIWYDKTYAPLYQLGYPDAEAFYKKYPDLMKKYGLAILKRYKMDRQQQEELACYLYLLGEKEPLITYSKSKMTQNHREVWNIKLKHFHIKLPKN